MRIADAVSTKLIALRSLENYSEKESPKIAAIFLSLTALSVLLPIIGIGLSSVKYLLLIGGTAAFYHQWIADNAPRFINKAKEFVESKRKKKVE